MELQRDQECPEVLHLGGESLLLYFALWICDFVAFAVHVAEHLNVLLRRHDFKRAAVGDGALQLDQIVNVGFLYLLAE